MNNTAGRQTKDGSARREHLRLIGQKPGQLGRNPWGYKDKDGVSRATAFREVGDETTAIDSGGSGVTMSKIRAIIAKVFDAAAAGDIRAAGLVLDGYFGKVKDQLEGEYESFGSAESVLACALKLAAQGKLPKPPYDPEQAEVKIPVKS